MSPSSQTPTDARSAYIASVRKLADWLEANEAAPVPSDERILIPLITNQAVEEFAHERGLTVAYDSEGNASVGVGFGAFTYHAYGYVDFATHYERNNERQARAWASKRGMDIVVSSDAETGGAK